MTKPLKSTSASPSGPRASEAQLEDLLKNIKFNGDLAPEMLDHVVPDFGFSDDLYVQLTGRVETVWQLLHDYIQRNPKYERMVGLVQMYIQEKIRVINKLLQRKTRTMGSVLVGSRQQRTLIMGELMRLGDKQEIRERGGVLLSEIQREIMHKHQSGQLTKEKKGQ